MVDVVMRVGEESEGGWEGIGTIGEETGEWWWDLGEESGGWE